MVVNESECADEVHEACNAKFRSYPASLASAIEARLTDLKRDLLRMHCLIFVFTSNGYQPY